MTNKQNTKPTKKKNGSVISFINMKGGVGKTTLAVNIADKLVEKNYSVLVIDMDPQFNSTQSLLLHKVILEKEQACDKVNKKIDEDDENKIATEQKSTILYEELEKEKMTTFSLFSRNTLTEPHKNIITNIKENLDLIAGNLELADEVSGDTANKVGVLSSFFDEFNIKNNYHFILIDCPPTWSIITHSSLFASNYYVIPSKVDLYSSIGIKLLEKKISEKLKEDYLFKKMNKPLINLGIIFSLYHKNVKAEENRKSSLIKEFPDFPFFSTPLPYLPSVPTRFVMFSDSKNNSNYDELKNSIEKITEELIGKIIEKEEDNDAK